MSQTTTLGCVSLTRCIASGASAASPQTSRSGSSAINPPPAPHDGVVVHNQDPGNPLSQSCWNSLTIRRYSRAPSFVLHCIGTARGDEPVFRVKVSIHATSCPASLTRKERGPWHRDKMTDGFSHLQTFGYRGNPMCIRLVSAGRSWISPDCSPGWAGIQFSVRPDCSQFDAAPAATREA